MQIDVQGGQGACSRDVSPKSGWDGGCLLNCPSHGRVERMGFDENFKFAMRWIESAGGSFFWKAAFRGR